MKFTGYLNLPRHKHHIKPPLSTHDLGMTGDTSSPGLRVLECHKCGELYVVDLHSATHYHLARDERHIFLDVVRKCKGKPQ